MPARSLSTKKLIPLRASMFAGPRRKKPGIRAHNAQVRKRVENEKDLIQRLMQDADIRRSILGPRAASEPFTVWTDFDHPDMHCTQINACNLPPWNDLGELAKLQVLFCVALDAGGYAFTARVRPDLEAGWDEAGLNPMTRVKRLIDRAVSKAGLNGLEYAYVLESRTRRGGSRTGLHLHGIFLASDALTATRFNQVLEQAICFHPKGKAAAGFKPHSGKPIKIEPVYDKITGNYGRGRWVNYMTKNTLRWDDRFSKRTYISRTATQTAREMWALIREEPLPEVE